jgi:hypothetical protein
MRTYKVELSSVQAMNAWGWATGFVFCGWILREQGMGLAAFGGDGEDN